MRQAGRMLGHLQPFMKNQWMLFAKTLVQWRSQRRVSGHANERRRRETS